MIFAPTARPQGQEPACSEVCPTGALISGKRGEMLEIAHQRIDENPMLSASMFMARRKPAEPPCCISRTVDFDKLGFPELDDRSLPDLTWPYMKAVPWVVVTVRA